MSKTNLGGFRALQTTFEVLVNQNLACTTDCGKCKSAAYKNAAKWLKEEIELIEELEKAQP